VEGTARIEVADTGRGIAPEFLPYVFERFRQAESGTTRERRGLGLGLAIARQIAEMHGGTIEASSAGVGRGSTFRVRLPLMVVQPSRSAEPHVHPRAGASAAASPSASVDLSRIHVLAVDDEPDALELIGEVLRAAGARVTTATSGRDALSAVELEIPDVLVTDIGMPGLDGFALMDFVRRHADDAVRQVPAAALTAYARSEDRMKALRAGFQMHLAKPIDPAELVTTVAALAKRFVQR
jgi:CheY-like chemotaxis protein